MKKPLFCLLFSVIFLFALSAEQRTALVIGNTAYEGMSRLRNPANDARDIGRKLSGLGFEVTTLIDGTQKQMDDAIYTFGSSLTEGGVGLFYYSGHGAQYEGENYLIPVNATIRNAAELRYKAVPAGIVLEYMNTAHNPLNMVILDACRDNPFAGAKSGTKGLTVVSKLPKGSIIVYATAPGQTAEDGTGKNSPFTEAFLKHVGTDDLNVKDLFDRVGREVSQGTRDRQRPWISHDFYGEFSFAGGATAVAAVEEVRGPTFSVQKAYGSVEIAVKTAGTLYLSGERQGPIPAGGTAALSNLETDSYALEMRYEDGKTESKRVTIQKDRTVQVSFSYVPRPTIPEGFVLVEAGSFQMGSTDGDADEKPVHSVTITKSFYMSQYEVTQKQWREVMGTSPSKFKGDDLPVEQVSWYDAVEYCNKLSRKEGLTPCYSGSGENIRCDFSANGYRLPTEAEWEYAARGGTKSGSYTYSGSNTVDGVGWYSGNSGNKTHAAGQKQPNELGLYDMSGNVWEWCWDWYDKGYYASSLPTDPKGPSGSSYRVSRGGSWYVSAQPLRAANRVNDTPSRRNRRLGFRPLRTGP